MIANSPVVASHVCRCAPILVEISEGGTVIANSPVVASHVSRLGAGNKILTENDLEMSNQRMQL